MYLSLKIAFIILQLIQSLVSSSVSSITDTTEPHFDYNTSSSVSSNLHKTARASNLTMADEIVDTLDRLLRTITKKKAALRLTLQEKTVQDLEKLDLFAPGTNCTSLVSTFTILVTSIKDKYAAFNTTLGKITVAYRDLKAADPDIHKQYKPQIDQLFDDADDLEIESDSLVSKLTAICEVCSSVISMNSKVAKSKELLALECEEKKAIIEFNKKAAHTQQVEADARQREVELKEQESQRAASAPAPSPAANSNPGQLKLFKTELDKFSGNIKEWQSFWDKFEVNIHSNDSVPVITKFTVLKDHLSGEALKLIDNFAITNENYVEAFNMLQARYGNKQVIAQLHYKSIQDLPPATMDPTSLDITHTSLECELRSLERLGEDVNVNNIRMQIFGKFPHEVFEYVRDRADLEKDSILSTVFVRKAITKYIERKRESLHFAAVTPSSSIVSQTSTLVSISISGVPVINLISKTVLKCIKVP